MALDANSTVWTFRSWGWPVRLVSPSLDCSSPVTTPIQAECGPWYCAGLTMSGDAYAWWTNLGAFDDQYWKTYKTTTILVPDHDTMIPCQTRELRVDPTKLPALPDLPDLSATGLSEEERRKETRLIKIAACYNYLIGLTNKGHVLKLDGFGMEDRTRIWHYVSKNVCSGAIL